MEQFPAPLRCSHVSQLNYAAGRTHPLPCRAEAAYLVDDAIHRCADHLTELLVSDPGRSWDITLVATRRDIDANTALTQAGVPCALDRLQEAHATIAYRIDVLAEQRNRLERAFAWLNEEPGRLAQVQDEISSHRAQVVKQAQMWAKYSYTEYARDPEHFVDMQTPTVGQAIDNIMARQQVAAQAAG